MTSLLAAWRRELFSLQGYNNHVPRSGDFRPSADRPRADRRSDRTGERVTTGQKVSRGQAMISPSDGGRRRERFKLPHGVSTSNGHLPPVPIRRVYHAGSGLRTNLRAAILIGGDSP
jgi:hypothetical protein